MSVMPQAEAQKLFGLTDVECQSVQSIRAMFAIKVRECHSDTSADGTSNAEMLKKLLQAKETLLATRIAPAAHCTNCKGRGMVRNHRGGQIQCAICKGTGDKYGHS